MNANIISLKNSPRRGHAYAMAIQCGLVPIFFDAVDAKTLKINNSDLIRSNELFHMRYGRAHSIVELATLRSHRNLYQSLLEKSEEYSLILEDDFIPLSNSHLLVDIITAMEANNIEVCILGYPRCDDVLEEKINQSNPIKTPIRITAGNHTIIGQRCIETTCGCLGYIVSRSFLNKALRLDSYGYLADDWVHYAENGVKITHAMPAIFREDFINTPSTMSLMRNKVLRDPIYKKFLKFTPRFLSKISRIAIGKYRLIRYKYF